VLIDLKLVDSFQSVPPIKICVKAENGTNAVVFHHRDVDGIASRKPSFMLYYFSRPHNVRLLDRENLICYVQGNVKRRVRWLLAC
jgi:hypothetical protein